MGYLKFDTGRGEIIILRSKWVGNVIQLNVSVSVSHAFYLSSTAPTHLTAENKNKSVRGPQYSFVGSWHPTLKLKCAYPHFIWVNGCIDKIRANGIHLKNK